MLDKVIETLLNMNGGLGILCALLLLAIIYLVRQNNCLSKVIFNLQQSRIEDAKHAASAQLELADKLRGTVDSVSQSLASMRVLLGELLSAMIKRGSKE